MYSQTYCNRAVYSTNSFFMKIQETRSVKQTYEQPQTSLIRLPVEAVVCQSGGVEDIPDEVCP